MRLQPPSLDFPQILKDLYPVLLLFFLEIFSRLLREMFSCHGPAARLLLAMLDEHRDRGPLLVMSPIDGWWNHDPRARSVTVYSQTDYGVSRGKEWSVFILDLKREDAFPTLRFFLGIPLLSPGTFMIWSSSALSGWGRPRSFAGGCDPKWQHCEISPSLVVFM